MDEDEPTFICRLWLLLCTYSGGSGTNANYYEDKLTGIFYKVAVVHTLKKLSYTSLLWKYEEKVSIERVCMVTILECQ